MVNIVPRILRGSLVLHNCAGLSLRYVYERLKTGTELGPCVFCITTSAAWIYFNKCKIILGPFLFEGWYDVNEGSLQAPV